MSAFNTGSINTGTFNTGDFNTGTWNTGDLNIGGWDTRSATADDGSRNGPIDEFDFGSLDGDYTS